MNDLAIEICQNTQANAEQILTWRNDPQTRAMFFHSEEQDLATFYKNFQANYFNDARAPAIFVTHHNARIAFLKFSQQEHPLEPDAIAYSVSINLAPDFRGKNLGAAVLMRAAEFLKERGVEELIAEIKIANQASVKAFEKAGYVFLKEYQKTISDIQKTFEVYMYLKSLQQKYLFFDLDGTIADSLPIMQKVYFNFLKQNGSQGSVAEFNSLNGPGLKQVLATLIQQHQLKISAEKAVSQYQALVLEAYQEVQPFAGLKKLLEKGQQFGWRAAIVTGNFETVASSWIKKNNLEKYFDFVVGYESVINGKPDPEPYRLALQKAQIKAAKAWVLEDTNTGMQSAQAAGIKAYKIDHQNEKQFEYFFKKMGWSLRL